METNKQNKPLYDYRDAIQVAKEIISILQPACVVISLAGSLRRNKPQVHDVDLVVYPKMDALTNNSQMDIFGGIPAFSHPTALDDILMGRGWGEIRYGCYPGMLTLQNRGGEIPVELYFTQPDGSNLGALLQMRTGSAEFNISLAERAKKLRLNYRAGYGVFAGEKCIAQTEEEIFMALGITYIPPERRDRDFRMITGLQAVEVAR
jgi:DNA polymerase/3'-5' exonuclease PolX